MLSYNAPRLILVTLKFCLLCIQYILTTCFDVLWRHVLIFSKTLRNSKRYYNALENLIYNFEKPHKISIGHLLSKYMFTFKFLRRFNFLKTTICIRFNSYNIT